MRAEPQMVRPFEVVSEFQPAGDQPTAIRGLSEGIAAGDRFQTLLGITGSGKSATIAWTIEQAQRPTLVLAPNKSLAAQLANEFREFFPHNRVEYFVSYYDYYQPEAYVPSSDTFIEKDSSVNDEIERLRHAATSALLTRRDVIVVASVSCIYGLGSPEQYATSFVSLRVGEHVDQRALLQQLVALQYDRNDMTLMRGTFRVRGDVIEIQPAYEESALRIELFGDEIDGISVVDPLTGEKVTRLDEVQIFAKTHYVVSDDHLRRALVRIEAELSDRLAFFESEGKLLEAQRLRMRTEYDLEMLREIGVCNGVENYSAPMEGRGPGEPPNTLLDYFPRDYLTIIDESHVTIPHLHRPAGCFREIDIDVLVVEFAGAKFLAEHIAGRTLRLGADQSVEQPLFRLVLRSLCHARTLLLAHHADGGFHEVADDLLDVPADITHLGKLGGLHFQERRIRKPGEPARHFRLPDTRGSDHQDILRRDFRTQVVRRLLAPPAVAQGDRNGALGSRLADDVPVKFGDDFARGQFGHRDGLKGLGQMSDQSISRGSPYAFLWTVCGLFLHRLRRENPRGESRLRRPAQHPATRRMPAPAQEDDAGAEQHRRGDEAGRAIAANRVDDLSERQPEAEQARHHQRAPVQRQRQQAKPDQAGEQ